MRNIMLIVLMASFAVPAAAQREYAKDLRDIGGKRVMVTHPWTRATGDVGRNAPVYFTVFNTTDEDDAIVGASSPYAKEVAVHETRENDMGIAVMKPVDGLALPKGVRGKLAPGGYHLMLVGITQPLELGMEVPVKVQFANSRDQNLRVKILGARSRGPHTGPNF